MIWSPGPKRIGMIPLSPPFDTSTPPMSPLLDIPCECKANECKCTTETWLFNNQCFLCKSKYCKNQDLLQKKRELHTYWFCRFTRFWALCREFVGSNDLEVSITITNHASKQTLTIPEQGPVKTRLTTIMEQFPLASSY
jgi:hypothetical protein